MSLLRFPFRGRGRAPVAAVVIAFSVTVWAQAPTLREIREQVSSGDLEGAMRAVDRYLETGQDERQGRFLKGVILGSQGRTGEAIEVFEALVRDHQDLPEPHNNLAVLYASQGDLNRARDALLQAIALHPSYAIAHENLGDIYTRMAEIAYQRATQLDESSRTARDKLALLEDVTRLAVTSAPAAAVTAAATPTGASSTPAPASTVTAGASREELLRAVEAWASAWSGQRVDAYLDSYSEDFRPASGGSRADWAARRRDRVSAPSRIDIDISQFQVERSGVDSARVSFTQRYASERYQDRVGKRLDLARGADGRWRIRREISLGAR